MFCICLTLMNKAVELMELNGCSGGVGAGGAA